VFCYTRLRLGGRAGCLAVGNAIAEPEKDPAWERAEFLKDWLKD